MTEYPPPKANKILKECVINIVQSFINHINDTTSQFPDVEENKVILINSVLSSAIAGIIIECTENLPNMNRRRYVRDILDNVRRVCTDVLNEQMKHDLFNNGELNESSE